MNESRAQKIEQGSYGGECGEVHSTPDTRHPTPDIHSVSGVLVLDKPEGITSAKAAAQVKKLLKPRKIGHTGTLDPFATGVLVLCLGEATRAADQILELDKVYSATLYFGVETDTLDKTGKVIGGSDLTFSEKDLLEVLGSFSGVCVQTVPRFSAVRVDGRRLYELSRKGIEVERPEREICIHSIALQSFKWPEAVVEVCCAKGVYIRQLASDIASRLGSRAHLSALRRTRVGPFTVDRALQPEEDFSATSAMQSIIPLNAALSHLPAASMIDGGSVRLLRHGQLDPEWEKKQKQIHRDCPGAVRIVTGAGRLAALWWPNASPDRPRRLRVFPF